MRVPYREIGLTTYTFSSPARRGPGRGRKIDSSAEALQVRHHLLIFPSKETNCMQHYASNRTGNMQYMALSCHYE
jgi:hypothetical protein